MVAVMVGGSEPSDQDAPGAAGLMFAVVGKPAASGWFSKESENSVTPLVMFETIVARAVELSVNRTSQFARMRPAIAALDRRFKHSRMSCRVFIVHPGPASSQGSTRRD